MKLISILIALLIIGFLVNKQMSSKSSDLELNDTLNSENLSVPKVPTSPDDLQKFEENINDFMQETAKKNQKKLN